ncbi:MAG: hypothetical protein SPL13_04085 [Clostridia bacterium]|nr:hypothetical protein [Clostridia bacterium]
MTETPGQEDFDAFVSGSKTVDNQIDNTAKDFGVILSDKFSLKANGTAIPCYSARSASGVHSFAVLTATENSFPVSVSIKSSAFKNPAVLPVQNASSPTTSDGTITFTIKNFGNITVCDKQNYSDALTISVRKKVEYDNIISYEDFDGLHEILLDEVFLEEGEHVFETVSETDYFDFPIINENVFEFFKSSYNLCEITATRQNESVYDENAVYYVFDGKNYITDNFVNEENFETKKDSLYTLITEEATEFGSDKQFFKSLTSNYSVSFSDNAIIKENTVIIFKNGIHTVSGKIDLQNNSEVFFEDGAYVFVSDPFANEESKVSEDADFTNETMFKKDSSHYIPLFRVKTINNVKIYGNAIIDFSKNGEDGKSFVITDGCSDVEISHLTLINLSEWAIDIRTTFASVNNVGIISYRDDGKGIFLSNVAAQTNVTYCFARTADTPITLATAYFDQGHNLSNISITNVNAITDGDVALYLGYRRDRFKGYNESDNIVMENLSLVTLNEGTNDSAALLLDVRGNNLIKNMKIKNAEIYSAGDFVIKTLITDTITPDYENLEIDPYYTEEQYTDGLNPITNLVIENVYSLSGGQIIITAPEGFTATYESTASVTEVKSADETRIESISLNDYPANLTANVLRITETTETGE